MKKSEIYRLVNDYIGVDGGYLGDFSYRTHREFYPCYCDLDNIDVDSYEQGTTRKRFIAILEDSPPAAQAKIIQGVLNKYPVSSFSDEEREQKQVLYNEFTEIIKKLEPSNSGQGAKGEIKNLIFAANGLKPDIVLSDSLNNDIKIVKNAEYCLVYDWPILEGVFLWENLVKWWANKNNSIFPENNSIFPDDKTEFNLYSRLMKSLNSKPEILLFETYFKRLRRELGDKFPALIPQVYLHYDPKTFKNLKGNKRLSRQRMDFLLLFSKQERVVIEVDGKQHYANDDIANPKKYAEMVSADRELRLNGYEIYRFGGYELYGKQGELIVENFFRRLFKKYKIL